MEIDVVIPAHPARVRSGMLARAMRSVHEQTLSAKRVVVAVDTQGAGAWATRDRALQETTAPWVAFLDSDDAMMPEHLAVLAEAAVDLGADYVFSYYQVRDAAGRDVDVDPLGHFGRVFDPADPHQTTITTLVRGDLAREVGFRQPPANALVGGQRYGEDFQFTLECVAAGATVLHVPQRTWWWYHHGLNSSGLPGRGDAVYSVGG